jgi:uncharacterized Zn finger protein
MKNLVPESGRTGPGGPRDCWRTRNVAASCSVCGARPEVVHISLHEKGFHCAAHCPNCGPAASNQQGEHQVQ